MAPRTEGTGLKRPKPTSKGDDADENELSKKPRRFEGNAHPQTPIKAGPLPSPLTNLESTTMDRDWSITPPSQQQPDSKYHLSALASEKVSPSQDSQTQPFSQIIYPPPGLAYEVEDEEAEHVWGYLIPLDNKARDTLVMRDRDACSSSSTGQCDDGVAVPGPDSMEQEEEPQERKSHKLPSRGYLIGRHNECDLLIDAPTVSNRHCILFSETKGTCTVAVLEDTSGNGTFVNDALVGRNNRRELRDGDEIAILDEARFAFRYPRHRHSSAFAQQYTILDKLGKGHFATVYLAVDKATGSRWAVKKFEKRSGSGEKNRMDGLQQEIAVLMSVSHPSLLCLKGAFEEDDAVYLILELASQGELFNWIVMKQKLTEVETRKLFVQLFKALKYLHERNVVHRDIKPENILLADDQLTVKLADFGLAKIIGEESFTTTLCGTPSYVAPEILQPSNRRRYTKAVDVWSLGVVLYICLCGFPPFSDELHTAENPHTLAQQILAGRFDFPSPYWDSVGDPALDLIDRMLTVDSDQRITIDECLEHPWMTGHNLDAAGESMSSTDGLLAGKMGRLDFSRRKPKRERTLLSSLNDVKIKIRQAVGADRTEMERQHQPPVKILEKNSGSNGTQAAGQGTGGIQDDAIASEERLGKKGGPEMQVPEGSGVRFLATGEKDDAALFANEEGSVYDATDMKAGGKICGKDNVLI